jgi:hypothetical protein
MRTTLLLLLALGPVLAGCGDGPIAPQNRRDVGSNPFMPDLDAAPAAGGNTPAGTGGTGNTAAGAATQPSETQATSPAPSGAAGSGERIEEATVDNVGVKGRTYGGGILTEPISQYFRAQDRIKLMQIDHYLQQWTVLNERMPADFAEFEREILQPLQVRLPELPPDREYVYDPKQGKLFVRIRPSQP